MGFLHGVETFEVQEGPVPVNEVKSAVVALVGTSPQGEPGEMYVIRKREDAEAAFSVDGDWSNGTLKNAFDAIFDHVNVTVLAINAGSNATVGDVIEAIPNFEAALSRFGFFGKIFIAPGFSHELGVAAELVATAEKCRGVALLDTPEGLTPEQAVTFKNNFGQGNAIVCYPKVKVFDTVTEMEKLDWLSGRMAGLMASVDKDEGYHVSPSNHVLQGIVGAERILDYIPNNEDTELNYVNSQGIVSVLYFLGSGYRLFGNRTCAFPFQSDPLTFIPWRRTASVIEESIEHFTLQFLDKPMFTRPADAKFGLLSRVEESVNDFIRALMSRGALVDGRCYVRLDDNPTGELAKGHLTYTYEITPPPPAERITYRAVINIKALGDVFAQIVGG